MFFFLMKCGQAGVYGVGETNNATAWKRPNSNSPVVASPFLHHNLRNFHFSIEEDLHESLNNYRIKLSA
jgi:hypothetical protein